MVALLGGGALALVLGGVAWQGWRRLARRVDTLERRLDGAGIAPLAAPPRRGERPRRPRISVLP